MMTEDEIVEAMMVAANDVINEDDTFHAGAMHAALRIALPWAREQALREAAAIVRAVPENPLFDLENGKVARTCAFAAVEIEALIPSRPSQEP